MQGAPHSHITHKLSTATVWCSISVVCASKHLQYAMQYDAVLLSLSSIGAVSL